MAPRPPGGQTRWIEITSTPLFLGEENSGPPSGAAVLFTDATGSERARVAQQALLTSFRLLGEAAPGLVLRVNIDAVVLQSAAGIGGEPAAALQGEALPDWLHPDDRLEFARFWRRLTHEVSGPRHLECRWRSSQGEHRWTILQANPIYDAEGEVIGAAVGLQDVHDVHHTRARLADAIAQLDQQRLLAEHAINGTRLATWDWDIATGEVTLSDRWAQIIGHTLAEIGPVTEDTWIAHIHPADIDTVRTALCEALEGQTESYEVETRRRHRDGHWVWVRDYGGVTERDEQGKAIRMAGIQEDISARIQAADALAASERHYRLLAENMSDAVWLVNSLGTVTWVSDSSWRLLGWRPEEVVGTDFVDLVHPGDRDLARDLFAVGASKRTISECRLRMADEQHRTLAIHASWSEADDDVVLALHDIQAEVAVRAELERAVAQDNLTGLVNREQAILAIGKAIAKLDGAWQGADRAFVGVMVAGVDGLTAINDAFTHAAGDQVIRAVGERLWRQAKSIGCLGRGSGDEFLIVVPSVRGESELAQIADQLRSAAKGRVQLGSQEVFPSVSIGIAYAGVGSDADELMRDAATAMRIAKNQGRDRVAFIETDRATVAQERLRIESEIRRALPAGEFVAWYQPVVDLESEVTVGFEALARWDTGSGQMIEPGQFLPVAERSALIVEIDRLMLSQAVAFLANLPDAMTVAVNVSGRTLGEVEYFDHVEELLQQYPSAAHRLHLEVTETSLPGLTEETARQIERLAGAGVKWYADDFGTGYSSIAILRDLPMSGIKLDRSFTHRLGQGCATSEQLARAIAALADELNVDAVAEGVESAEEALILLGQGWVHAQGWLFGRPVPAQEALVRTALL